MPQCLWSSSALEAGWVWVLVEPGRVGGQVAPCRSPLVDAPCHELPQTHKRVRGEGRGELVIRGCGGVSGRVLEEHVSGAGTKGLESLSHELGGGGCGFRVGGGACRMRGRRVRPSCRGRVHCAKGSTRRCFLSGGEGILVPQSRGR